MGNESGTWIMYGVDWEDPKVSWERIVGHMHEIYPIATDKQIRKVLK